MIQYRVQVEDHYFYIFPNEACPYGQGGPMENAALLMRELGLLSEGIFGVTFKCSDHNPWTFRYVGRQFQILSEAGECELNLDGYPLTSIGAELSNLIEIVPVAQYFD